MNKKNIKSILAVLIIILILIFLVCIEINTNKEYGNIGIDNSELNIFFFNVGQAESILITNNNAKMLIDCGNNSDGKYISKFLKEQGISELDYLIGTHIDEDHIGGMQEILTNIKVETLYMPYSTYEGKQFYIQLEEYIRDFCSKLADIVPERYEVIGSLPITSIQAFLNFNQLYLYLMIAVLLIIITICLLSIYKPIKYLAIPMISSGVMFAIFGSMNNFINDYVISNLDGLKPLISPFITILLTIIFKVGVLVSFSGVFLMIIYVVINRIVINNHKTK